MSNAHSRYFITVAIFAIYKNGQAIFSMSHFFGAKNKKVPESAAGPFLSNAKNVAVKKYFE